MKTRELKTFEKNLQKRFKTAMKGLKSISSVPYACETVAQNALSRYVTETPLVSLVDSQIQVVNKRANGTRGRPKEGEEMITQYLIEAFS